MLRKILLQFVFLALFFVVESYAGDASFVSARPVWPAGCDTSMNFTTGFRAIIETQNGERTVLRLAASSVYRFFINGSFAGHGPARGPHGWYRLDEWDITDRLSEGRNVIAIEVTGYNINNYYLIDQPAFLQAEVISGGKVLASTAGDGVQLQASVLRERVRRVQRYSFQRTFSEHYRLKPSSFDWRTDNAAPFERVELATQPQKKLLPRHAPLPDFSLRQPVRLCSAGQFETGPLPENFWLDRAITLVPNQIKGFPRGGLEDSSAIDMQRNRTVRNEALDAPFRPDSLIEIKAGNFVIFDFGTNLTGFPSVKLACREKARLYFTFDEILTDGDVDFKRLDCVSLVGWEVEPGEYTLETLEPYTLRYLKIMVMKGTVAVSGTQLREYANPSASLARFAASDSRLNILFEAARQNYRQNAVDIFMDCPSRERAGWLCDSYFTARAEQTFCGGHEVEKSFLENYLIPERYPNIPAGMLPMCYPSDSHNGTYIPNWALWFVLELEEYAARGGDRSTVEAARGKVQALFEFLGKYRNTDGLLEKLDSWVFVEWSEANDFVQDVNYPTNMLYAAALDAASRMYGIKKYAAEAEKVRSVIRAQSFDGTFFVDNAVRENGVLKPTRNRTETCQNYAFYLGTATPQSHPELWNRLVREFGPGRQKNGTWPEIFQSRPFIGNVLRLEILSRQGMAAQALEECRDYLLYMAERTGTLWEMQDQRASCNHGFASHTAHFLMRDVLGLKRVDPVNRTVLLRLSDTGIEWCEGSQPTQDGEITAGWWKRDGGIVYRAQVPAGWKLTVENNTGLPIRAL